ncbi:MAG: M1 family metallopeptidase [Bacteroidia bacterium]|nr:M1 family metallopeptidase [Bacteroidia bacterium]MDW8133781.1 M1 family metallopeptidase [Bacteroidia bacterium]
MRYLWLLLGLVLWAQQDMATRELLLKYDAKFWWLNLQVSNNSTQLDPSWVLTRLEVTAPSLDTLAFELLSSLIVDSVVVDGQRRSFLRVGNTIRVPLSPQPSQGALVEAIVYYRGSSSVGIYNRQSPTWGNVVTWTLTQPFSAHGWWPCKQILSDKADSLWLFITVPYGTRAGGNGVLEGIDTLPNQKVRFRWKSRYPTAYYLVAFSVAEYVDYSFYATIPGIPQPVLVQNYVYNNPQTLPHFKAEIDTTAALLREFSLRYGSYPFWREKYGHMMAPFSGGMEHQTMTTLGFFGFELTAHELAHQWFGDWVTCGSWQDIWLNEGFATYSEYVALQALGTPSDARNWLIFQIHDRIIQGSRGSVWVDDTVDESRIFNYRLSYAKGASLLHMIRFRVANDPLFWHILQSYLSSLGGGVALRQDFQYILEQVTGQSWQTFFSQWYYGEGHPIFSARWNEVGGNLWIELRQRGSWQASVPFFETPVEILVRRQGLPDTVFRLEQTQPIQLFGVGNVGTVTQIEIDPSYWLVREIDQIQRDFTLGVENWIEVTPLPVSAGQFLSVCIPTDGRIEVLDLSGKVLHTAEVNEPLWRFQVNMPAGMYFICWQNKEGHIAYKYFWVHM